MEIGLGDLLEALPFEQTLSTSMSEARNLRRAQLQFDSTYKLVTPNQYVVQSLIIVSY